MRDIHAGDILTTDNIGVIRPGYGMKPIFYHDILGKHAIRDTKRGTPLSIDMFGE